MAISTTYDSTDLSLEGLRVPKVLEERAGQLLAVTNELCCEHLDVEYARLCRRLVGMLARKRPSPLARGELAVWAAAVVCTVGAANFLFDRGSEPYLSRDEIARLTGVAKSTMANKSAAIRKALDLHDYDTELCRLDVLEHHPYAWYVEVNGFVLDARALPAAVQDEARRRGLIPDLTAAALRR